jgi:hypothetical protein
MKLKYTQLASIAVLSAMVSVTGCQRSSTRQVPAADPKVSPATGSSVDGSSTGGGSFGDESSLTILRWAAEDLASQIRNSSPEIYKNLPKGWTQERLAEVIRNVEPTAADQETYRIPEVDRYGQRLMFNYGKRNDGSPYITATRLFIDAYASYDVNSQPKQDFYYKIEEVKLKLAHEAAHLLGLGLSKEADMPEAREFAKSLLASLDSDNFECIPKEAPPVEIYCPLTMTSFQFPGSGRSADQVATRINQFTAKSTRVYVFNRPTGNAAVPISSSRPCQSPTGVVNFDQCSEDSLNQNLLSSGYISVFAPQSYDEKFSVPTIRKSIMEGVRDYGFKEGYFSWKLVDLRKAVRTDKGYKSNYKYSRENDMNNSFSDYLDFRVLQSSVTNLLLETYPSLQQENWDFYRSQGKSQLAIQFADGKITDAKLIILKSYNPWLEDKTPNDVNIPVALSCVRSFKPLVLPAPF